MYIFTLVNDVRQVVEQLRVAHGEFRLAMLYNTAFEPAQGWNFVISAPWTDEMTIGSATRIVANELNTRLGIENRHAISRITVLRASDPIVRDMIALYPVGGRGVPISQITAGTINEGSAFVFYSQRL